jgi:hypothetical protein
MLGNQDRASIPRSGVAPRVPGPLFLAVVKAPKVCWVPEEEQRLARNLVKAAGSNYLSEPYIGDVAREIRPSR